jgi:hypothetical protein
MLTASVTVPLGATGSERHPAQDFPPITVLLSWSPDKVAGHVWLHHGFARSPAHLDSLTARLVDSGFVVARPHVSSFRRPRTLNDGPYLAGVIRGYDTAVAGGVITDVVRHDVEASGFVMMGHSAGGAVVVHQAATLHGSTQTALTTTALTTTALTPTASTSTERATLTVSGIVLLDANESLSKLMEPALAELDETPVLLCSARPHRCNRQAMVSRMLLERRRGFVGALFPTGGHCDAEGRADLTCKAMCGGGTPDPADVAALWTLSTAWAADCAQHTIDPQWRPGGAGYDELLGSGRIQTLESLHSTS